MKLFKNGVEHEVTESIVAKVCVEICGGGWNPEQVADAMWMQEALFKGETVYKFEDEWRLEK